MPNDARFQLRRELIKEPLVGYALALARDKEAARDLFQDCIVKALADNSVPQPDPAFRSWLFSIMRNCWIAIWRRDRRHRREFERIAGNYPHWLRPEPDPDLSAVSVNQLAVRAAFDELTAQHRDVLALVNIAGFSYMPRPLSFSTSRRAR